MLQAAGIVVVGLLLTTLAGWGFLRAVADVDAAALLTLRPVEMAAALVLWTAALYCQGARWRALLPFSPLPSAGFLALVVGGTNVAHLAVPGPVAEVMAAWFVARRGQAEVSVALSATLVGRLLALAVLSLLVLATTAGKLALTGLPAWAAGIAAIAAAGGLSAGVCVALPATALAAVAGVLQALPGPRALRAAAWVRGWATGFVEVGQKARWGRATGWSAANALTLSCATALCFRAAGVPIDPLDVVWLHGILSLATVVMIVLPAGFGAVDALGGGLLIALGITDVAGATLCMVALRWVQLLSMALGLPAMAWMISEASAASAGPAVNAGPKPAPG